jgi:hypothetical protein
MDPAGSARVVDLAESARRDSIKAAWSRVVFWAGILWARTRLAGGATLTNGVAMALLYVCLFGFVLAFGEFLVRPKRLDLGGVAQTGFVALLPVQTPSPGRVVSFGGRMTFARDGITWVPGAQARRSNLATRHWPREDIADLRVERVRNLTPLGYLHLHPTGSAEIVFRVFQPKRLRAITAAFVPLTPPRPGPRTSP